MQTHRIIPTRRFERELVDISQYLSQDSATHAERVVDLILNQINSLEVMPHRFVQVGVSKRRDTPVHRLVVDPYLIYYRIEADAVYVLTVRHGARKQLKRFE